MRVASWVGRTTAPMAAGGKGLYMHLYKGFGVAPGRSGSQWGVWGLGASGRGAQGEILSPKPPDQNGPQNKAEEGCLGLYKVSEAQGFGFLFVTGVRSPFFTARASRSGR